MLGSAPAPASAGAPSVDVVPLGGLGEFGLNMMAISCGETTVVIDAGAMFPDGDLPGVDLIVPDLDYLEARKGQVRALVLTHGHEDHIGAVPYVLPLVSGPLYGTRLALALVEPKLEEHGVEHGPGLQAVGPRDRITVGPFTLEFIRVTHSMPDCVAVAIHTPQGVLLHTGDFKIDQTPLDGEAFDLPRFAQLGAEGVLALMCDSTNVDRRGFTGSEREVQDAFEELFTGTEGRLVVATFSSSLYRLQLLVDLAAAFDRKVAFVGRGMIENSQAAQRLGHLHLPTGVVIRDSDVASFPAQDVLCLVTGSQGEPNAALSRIAIDDHRHVRLSDRDRVVLSARAIPGNEKAIGRVINHLARRDVDVVTEADKHVHVSGHGSSEELKLVLSLVRPRYFMPIHGEYRQLARHAHVADLVTGGLEAPTTVLLAEDGDVVRSDAEGGRLVDKAPAGRVLIDSTRTGEVDDEVLRDRRHIAADGVVVPVVAINRQTGALEGVPELMVRGFVTADDRALLTEGAARLSEVIEGCGVEERTDPGLMQERIRTEVRRYLRKRTADGPSCCRSSWRFDVPTVAVPGSTLSRRLSEVVGVGLFAVSLIWLVSLASYDAGDPAWFFSTGSNDAPANFAGRVGAFLAELSFQLLGYASFLIPATVAVVGWRYFWCRPMTAAYTKLTGALLIFGCGSAFLAVTIGRVDLGPRAYRAGGYVGEWIGGWMAEYLSRTGSVIVLLAVMSGALILATQFSFGALFALAFSHLGSALRRGIENFRVRREERRKARQRRDVLAKHGKKDVPEPSRPPKVAKIEPPPPPRPPRPIHPMRRTMTTT